LSHYMYRVLEHSAKGLCFLPGRDLIGVQNLMKKHQALLAELAGHEPRIATVCGQGEQMEKEGHFAQAEIHNKIRELQDKWDNLKVFVPDLFHMSSYELCMNRYF